MCAGKDIYTDGQLHNLALYSYTPQYCFSVYTRKCIQCSVALSCWVGAASLAHPLPVGWRSTQAEGRLMGMMIDKEWDSYCECSCITKDNLDTCSNSSVNGHSQAIVFNLTFYYYCLNF